MSLNGRIRDGVVGMMIVRGLGGLCKKEYRICVNSGVYTNRNDDSVRQQNEVNQV